MLGLRHHDRDWRRRLDARLEASLDVHDERVGGERRTLEVQAGAIGRQKSHLNSINVIHILKSRLDFFAQKKKTLGGASGFDGFSPHL